MNVWFTSAPYLEMFSGAKQNPRYSHDDSAGVTASYIIDPYFFDGTVSGVTCIKCEIMLYQSQVTMGLCNGCHFSKIVLSAVHPVCEFLNE